MDHSALLSTSLFRVFGQSAVFTPVSGPSQAITIIHQTETVDAPELLGSSRAVAGKTAYIKLSDVPDVKRGDVLEIDSVDYEVDAELDNDGTIVHVSLAQR